MVPRRRWLLVASFLLAGILVVGPLAVDAVSGAPPPRPVCAACGDSLQERAGEEDLSITVTNSTVTVLVHENTTATWVVRNRIRGDEALTRLRANETLRRHVVQPRYWEPELQSVTVSEEGVLTARYRHSDFATSSVGGTMRADVFSEAYGYGNLDGLGADRLVVEAPEGTAIRSSVPGGDVSEDRTRLTLTDYDRGGFVTFVPRERTLGELWSWLAVADLVWPTLLLNGLVGVVVPAGLVATVVAAGTPLVDRTDRLRGRISACPGRVLVGSGLVGVSLALVGGALGVFGTGTVPLFGIGVGVLAVGIVAAFVTIERPGYRHVLAGATLGAGVAVLAAILGASLFYSRVPWLGIRPTLPFVPAVFAFAPAGFALARGHRTRAVLTATFGVVVASILGTPLIQPVWILPVTLRVAFALGDALGVVVVGLPFLVFGGAIADGHGERSMDDGRPAQRDH